MKDYTLSVLAGFFTGILIIPIISNLGYTIPYSGVILPLGIAILFGIGMVIGKFIGRYVLWIFQFAKYVATGFLNAAIDFGILNFLIFVTGIASGIGFSSFKAISFIVANLNGFIWNRHWVFKSKNNITKEYFHFFVVSLIGLLLNVGSASFVVNGIGIQFDLTPALWANIGAVVGSAIGILWNFLGYKFIVFKA